MKFPILKELLSRLGVLVPPRLIHYVSGLLNYLSVGRWFHDRKLAIPIRCAGREELYNQLAKSIVEPVSYLEFGVFKGVTLRHWTTLLRHADTRFDGFDSFVGLPENWGYFCDKKLFDVQGQMPKYDDARVQLHKGWFTDTLPGFLTKFQARPTLILHLDADLYSSTIFVLRQMRPWLREGTILIFDEFFDREHEMKALTEFMQDERMSLKCLAATRALSQTAFQITSLPSAPTMPPQAHGDAS
jgi:Methyltransferase domain